MILDPVPEDMRLPAGDDALTRASERLDERLKLARGIRQHLERDIALPEDATTPMYRPPPPRAPRPRRLTDFSFTQPKQPD